VINSRLGVLTWTSWWSPVSIGTTAMPPAP